jgi:arylsulfatase
MSNFSRIIVCITTCMFTLFTNGFGQKKLNIVLIVSDDTGWGDLGVYGGGGGRGAATPNLDRMAHEGLQFMSFYGQPSCTPGRAALMTGRLPNRSGMTTVAFPGQGGGLPKEEWTVASVLKKAGYTTFFTGKWHLGEEDYSLPNAQGFDEMKYVYLYHLNAYTYNDTAWNPDWPSSIPRPKLRGALSGKAGEKPHEDFSVNGEYVNTPEKGIVGIPYLDEYVEKAATDYLKDHAKSSAPFFMSVDFTKNHQPNMPHPDFINKSEVKSKYGDAVVEMDTRVGRVLQTIRDLGIEDNTLVIYTVDNGAWQDVYPDCGYTPFRGTKGTDMEGGSRVPTIAWWPGHIKPGGQSWDIAGGLDLMATFASLASIPMPTLDRAGKPIIFDSYDLTPILLSTGKSKRTFWIYQTEDELSPGAVRLGKFKAVFNLRGDYPPFAQEDHSGWRGESKYVATAFRLYDLWQDPGEHYDVTMTNWTEKTWMGPAMGEVIKNLISSYIKYPSRPEQTVLTPAHVTNDQFRNMETLKQLEEQLKKRAGD